jgi:F420-dependent oxidoreductase-like protein
MTQIGIMLEGQLGLTWSRWRRLIQTAEDFGFQCLFRSDHFTTGPDNDDALETFVSLTYAADHSKRIEFGTLVAPTTFRHPAMTARMAAAIDDLSGGRMVLGLGAGWNEREHRQFGIPFYDKATRFEMLVDALEITTRLFASDEPVSYQGKHFSLDEAILLSRPQRPGGPTILIGGNGPTKTLPLAAQYADEWNGVFLSPETYRERNQLLDGLLEEAGREPGDVKRSLMTEAIVGADDAAVRARAEGKEQAKMIIGTPSAVVDRIAQYADAGAERVMLQWLNQDDIAGLELIARDVLPHFHK